MEIKDYIKKVLSKVRRCTCEEYTILGGLISHKNSEALVQKVWARCKQCKRIDLRRHVYNGVIKSFQYKAALAGQVHIEFNDERTDNVYSIHTMLKNIETGHWMLPYDVLKRSLEFASHRMIALDHELNKRSSHDDISKALTKAEKNLRLILSGLRVETSLVDGNILLSMMFKLYGYERARYYYKWEKNKNKDLLVIEKRKKGRTLCK